MSHRICFGEVNICYYHPTQALYLIPLFILQYKLIYDIFDSIYKLNIEYKAVTIINNNENC
jgi:hypothetical protein